MPKTYEQVSEMFASIATLGKGIHHGALSTTKATSSDRKLYAPKSTATVESMSTKDGWVVVGTFADVAPHVELVTAKGESQIYKLAPAPAPVDPIAASLDASN